MKPFVKATLERQALRLQELDAQLSDEHVTADLDRYRRLSKEHAELSEIIALYQQYLQRQRDLQEAQSWANDPEMAEMAQEEQVQAELDMAQLNESIQHLLLPKNPDDSRNAYVEIRAGTGGDESALFAGDLLRMYTRYCENVGLRVESMSESASELGGYKEVVIRVSGDQAYGR
jgi:peptide chain release factor 1